MIATAEAWGASGVDRGLLASFLHVYPFQPATALFRAIEIEQVASRPLPSGVGIDLGCGDGLLTGVLFERTGPRPMIGIDPDPAEISLARALRVYDAVHVASGSAIPAGDNSCDWVFSNSVLEHVDDIPGIFKEVARVLKPGGRFIFTVPGDQFHDCLGGPMFPWADRDRYFAQLDARVAHRRYWSERQWQTSLDQVGLVLTSASHYMTRSELRRWELLARMTAGVLYGLFGRSKQPIEIQRTLGLRRAGMRMPKPIAWLLAHTLALGLPRRLSIMAGTPAACLRIEAEKRSLPTS